MFVTNSNHNIIRLYEYADLDMNSVSDEMYMGYTGNWSKIRIFSSYISEDSLFTCDHFDGKVVVKG